MEVIEILSHTQSLEYNVRKNAESYLQKLEERSICDFFITLSTIMAQETYEFHLRELAGLILKNRLETKKKNNQDIFICKWLILIDDRSRCCVKQVILNVLNSSRGILRKIAAQIMAKIITIELINEEENDILFIFLDFLEKKEIDIHFYHSILEIIEFVCQEIGFDVFPEKNFKKHAFQIVKLLLISINEKESIYEEAKISSLNGFLSIMSFIGDFFEKDFYRDFIFKSIYALTKTQNISVKALAFEVLCKMIKTYYTHLVGYVSSFCNITVDIIKNESNLVVVQILEFWIMLANQELEMNLIEYQFLNEGKKIFFSFQCCVTKVSFEMSNLLLNYIKANNNKNSLENWNCLNAANSCLNSISQLSPRDTVFCGILCIDKIISDNFFTGDARFVVFIFTAVFDGIGSKFLYTFIKKRLLDRIFFITNKNPVDFSVVNFIIGKVSCDCSYMLRYHLNNVISTLVTELIKNTDHSLYWCLTEILQSFNKEGVIDWCFREITSFVLKIFVFKTYNQEVAFEIFEFILSLVVTSDIRNGPCIFSFLPYLMIVFIFNFFTKKKHIHNQETQGYVCRLINCTIQRYARKLALDFIKKLLAIFFKIIFDKKNEINCSLEEEVLIFMNLIIQSNKFKTLPKFKKWMIFLITCIRAAAVDSIVILSFEIISDICTTMENEIKPFAKELASIIIKKITKNILNKKIIATAITCLGDITLIYKFDLNYFQIIMDYFEKMMVFSQDLLVEVDKEDFILNLKITESVLIGLTGIIQQIQEHCNSSVEFFNKLKWISDYVYFIFCKNRTLTIVKICIGLIGDLYLNFRDLKYKTKKECWIFQLINESKNNKERAVSDIGTWVLNFIYGE